MQPSAKKTTVLLCIGLVFFIIILGVCVMFFQNHGNKTITEINSFSLRLSGMRITEEYEMKAGGAQTEILYYTMSYKDGAEEKVLQKSTVCDTQTVIDTLNACNVMKWDGFHGKHPRGVLDGTTFSLSATVNGGQTMQANGSQNFPKHFYELEEWLHSVLQEGETNE